MPASRFDDTTVWPDDEYLPEGFDSTYSDDLSSLKDDDDYEELPDYIKDGYWLIKKNDGSGTFYRIAKDQITTAIGSSARRIYQMAKGEEDIGELEDMFKAIFENIGVEKSKSLILSNSSLTPSL